MAESLTSASIRADIAELLCVAPEAVSDATNLFELGLDSLRLMTLLERWRESGVDTSFVELAERPYLPDWTALLRIPENPRV